MNLGLGITIGGGIVFVLGLILRIISYRITSQVNVQNGTGFDDVGSVAAGCMTWVMSWGLTWAGLLVAIGGFITYLVT